MVVREFKEVRGIIVGTNLWKKFIVWTKMWRREEKRILMLDTFQYFLIWEKEVKGEPQTNSKQSPNLKFDWNLSRKCWFYKYFLSVPTQKKRLTQANRMICCEVEQNILICIHSKTSVYLYQHSETFLDIGDYQFLPEQLVKLIILRIKDFLQLTR